MTEAVLPGTPASLTTALKRAVDLLGGEELLGRPVQHLLDVHLIILNGLPYAAALHLLEALGHSELTRAAEDLVGISLRTLRRRRGVSARLLTREQGGVAWRLAEALVHATEVLGLQDAGERWLVSPAMVLNQNRSVDLLATSAGARAVTQVLGRMQHGTYS